MEREASGLDALRRAYSQKFHDVGMSEFHEFQYQLSDGHDGEVNCIDASDNLDWILSGGCDTTARLWHWNEKHFQCYRLYMVLKHTHPVTSVAFAGDGAKICGPAVLVTKHGDLIVTNIAEGTVSVKERQVIKEDGRCIGSKEKVCNEEIVDVRFKREIYKSVETELLALAMGTSAHLTEVDPCPDGSYVFNKIAEFEVSAKIVSAQHMPGDIEHGAALATASERHIILWSLSRNPDSAPLQFDSHRVIELDPQDSTATFTCFHIVQCLGADENWGWLAGGADTILNIWPVRDGEVLGDKNSKIPCPGWPMRYDIQQKVCDVTISPHCTTFVVQREDMASEMRSFVPAKTSSDNPGQFLLMTEPQETVQTPVDFPCAAVLKEAVTECPPVENVVQSNEMCMRQTKQGKRMVVSFHDGSVSVWKWPSKQGSANGEKPEMLAALRSMTLMEVIMPIIMRLMLFAQVTTFAFGPATDFSEGVDRPMRVSNKLVNMDIAEMIPSVKPSDLFFPEIFVASGLMCTFLLLALTAAPEKLSSLKTSWMRGQGYGNERLNGKTFGCYHLFVGFLSLVRSCVGLFIGLCSTALVVPMFKICAKVVDCVHPHDRKAFLAANPNVLCYESTHWKLIGAFGILVPLYFLVLLPYAAVEGDSQFMFRVDLFKPRRWREHGKTKGTLLYQGPMHPNADSIFETKVIELLAKIALPVVVILTSSRPLLQTCLVAASGGLSVYVVALWKPPIVDPVMCSFIGGTQLFTLLCMTCGILTVVCPVVFKKLSEVMLLVSLIISLGVMCFQIARAKLQPSKFSARVAPSSARVAPDRAMISPHSAREVMPQGQE